VSVVVVVVVGVLLVAVRQGAAKLHEVKGCVTPERLQPVGDPGANPPRIRRMVRASAGTKQPGITQGGVQRGMVVCAEWLWGMRLRDPVQHGLVTAERSTSKIEEDHETKHPPDGIDDNVCTADFLVEGL